MGGIIAEDAECTQSRAMFDAADVHVDGHHACGDLLRDDRRLIVAVEISQIIPTRVEERVQCVGISTCITVPAKETLVTKVTEGEIPRQTLAESIRLDASGLQGQIEIVKRDRCLLLVATEQHWNRRAPSTLS